MKPKLTYHKPHVGGRILAFSGDRYIGHIYPLGDGRVSWFLDRDSEERGTAKSEAAAKDKLAEAFARWVIAAGLVWN